ncbi:hypothetical protein PIB30_022735 [Stylosanthes scabra]|uniref:Kinesin-like protein n=1 Tax=Stylosanthes scabra TaxID=79078 RepID=A0ABU6Z8P3_9FABA|nr:hypothetical protein [Stylosanthes scabra]
MAATQEKIRVTVRMRPLNHKEQAMHDDLIAWECFHDQRSIIFNNPNQESSATATPYTFDKVFAPSCSTQQVYDEGVRDVALSALSGINATIFAYGQTSSGKTFTMRGIVENAIKDIYDYIKNKPEQHFILKIAALEIYNETVIDLLNPESGPLRLVDDPERGTIVEKLNEQVAKDAQHLRHLIAICQAHRQVGETSLNDKSSRSHQIIRLTLESSLRESSGHEKTLVASLNFVDLAGSERISQTKICGVRLKEGNHINRSLLTLSTVIRKLSGGKRGHIPYRDSKLTRILQSALGGNARTAIICTISPSLSHVEQTKNTLTFATSAKEVVNNACVNMVVSDKTLVRQLQKEVARLEGEIRSPELSSSCLRSLLAEKDLKIKQMEKDMGDPRCQRDVAQSQLELARSELELERRANKVHKGSNDHRPSGQVVRCLSFSEESESAVGKHTPDRRKVVGRQAILASPDPSILVGEIRKLEHRQLQLCEDANRALEVMHKDFATHNLGNQETAERMSKVLSEIKDLVVAGSSLEEIVTADKADLKKMISQFKNQGNTIASLERKLENVQKSIDKLVSTFGTEETPDSKTQLRELEIENRVPTNNNIGGGGGTFARDGSPAARKSKPVDVKKIHKMFKSAVEENMKSFKVYVAELKELVAKLHYQKQLLICQVLELEVNESASEETDTTGGSPVQWEFVFEEQRQQITMLWHLCHIPVVHRTQFYLLLRGDPYDQIYMEVELRRLTWLEQHLSELGNASPALLSDEPADYVSASIRALRQEREYLAKRVNSKLTAQERELVYAEWEVPPGGKKQRRLEFINKLWSGPYNIHHVQESAQVVAKLIDFSVSDENSKDMFELNFASPYNKKTWGGWNFVSNLLHL